jgi:hypothetical protein
MDFLSWFALAIMILVVLILAYGMIAIHDVPYHMAKKRNHPHQDAIHTAGWISLFTLHAIWPFLWIWATSYHPEHGYAGNRPWATGKQQRGESSEEVNAKLARLEERIRELEAAAAKSTKA